MLFHLCLYLIKLYKVKKIFTSAMFLILLSVSAQTKYQNKAFEISAIMPEGWVVGNYTDTTKDMELTYLARTKMLNEKKSVYLTDYHMEDDPMIGPKIQINVITKPENTYQAFKAEAIRSADKLKKHFKKFEYIQKPLEITVGGIKSIHFIIKHDMIVIGKEMRVKNHIYGIPYKNYLFMITLTDVESGDCTKVFDEFIKTIKIGSTFH